jgi:hypothetical protein
MDVISVKLPAPLRLKLAREARRRNVPQCVIVRESIERALTEAGTGATRKCSDLAGDLVGSIRSGRPDAGTNKALLAEAVLADYKRARKRRR